MDRFTVDVGGESSRHVDVDVEAAYVRAVLAVLGA